MNETQQAKETAVAQAFALAGQYNGYVLENYRGALVQWKQHHDWAQATGKPDRPVPQPPFSKFVFIKDDGWPEIVDGPQMKDETPKDPPPLPTGLIAKLGPYYYQDLWSADPTDNAPVGYILEVDGKRYTRVDFGSAFGKRLGGYRLMA